ncbi:MAG TPA: lysophospholipid acyltransferase family protein [Candidatus Acidoferrales bacterium]|nr:lysophospholipid acyltransferase family protein [Candidatus Acidoferrales bacterium]
MTFRAVGRLFWFAWEVVVVIINYFLTAARAPQDQQRLERAAWLSRSSRRHLRIFGYTAGVSGTIPRSGLLFCNHLSYLDILAISAVTPAVFVSKADVRRWPLFGWFAVISGTVFVDRTRRHQVGRVNQEIEAALADGALVVVFPEGTSSNGETILPFRTSLLEPAARGHYEISVGWLHYELEDGDARQEVCYWGDQTFFPHVVHLLGKKSIRATLRFGKFQRTTDDRKLLAGQLRETVMKLKLINDLNAPAK